MYQLLPRSDLENDDASSEDLKAQASPALELTRQSVSLWALVACIVCTLANLASIYISPPSSLALPQSVAFLLETPRLARQDISRLRHPNQFIGLDRIHKHLSTNVEPFVNWPFLSARIDKSAPDKSFAEDDQRGYMTPIGTVVSERRRILLTPTASTILQFRAIDYGMEACELRISLPAVLDGRDDVVGEPSFAISDLPITLHLSQLNAQFPLDPETVSFRSQPSLLRDVGHLVVQDLPATFTYNFTCAMEEVLTFKLGCESEECHVEWLQDHGNSGITLVQYPSL